MGEGPTFSEELKELMQKIENRNTAKRMSNDELSSLRKAIDDEMVQREAVKLIQDIANRLK